MRIKVNEKRPKLVMIDWVDIRSEDSWTNIEKASNLTPTHCVTVGFMLKKTRQCVVVVATLTDVDEYDDFQQAGEIVSLPIGCIKRITTLKYPWKRSGNA